DPQPLPGHEVRGDRLGPQMRGRDGQGASLSGDARAERPVLRTEWGKSVMSCERIREQIPECLGGRLDPESRERLVEHLEGCAGCRAEVAELNAVWRAMESLKSNREEAPDAVAKARFMDVLEAYRA